MRKSCLVLTIVLNLISGVGSAPAGGSDSRATPSVRDGFDIAFKHWLSDNDPDHWPGVWMTCSTSVYHLPMG